MLLWNLVRRKLYVIGLQDRIDRLQALHLRKHHAFEQFLILILMLFINGCLLNPQHLHTKPVVAFDEAELANLLLRMCPESWQDQYDLMQDSLPQSIRKKK